MFLFIYDQNLSALGVVDEFSSLTWTASCENFGAFEISAPATKNNLYLLKNYNLVRKNDCDEIGFINYSFVTSSEEGDTIFVKGFFYEGVLEKRCVLENASNIKSLITKNLRDIPNFVIDDSLSQLPCDEHITGENLGRYLLSYAKIHSICFFTQYLHAENKILLSFYCGTDFSDEQSVNPFCIFSDNFDNLFSAECLSKSDKAVNTVYGFCDIPDGVSYSNIPTFSVEDGDGVTKFEDYVKVDAVTFYLDDRKLLDYPCTLLKLKEAVYKKIAKPQFEFAGNVKISDKNSLKIGDFVSVKKSDWDLSSKRKIVKIVEFFDNKNNYVVLTFGNLSISDDIF